MVWDAIFSFIIAQVSYVGSAKIDHMAEVSNVNNASTLINGVMDAHTKASDLSIFSMFFQANFVVQFVMLLLISASILSWTIAFNKYIHFKKIQRRMQLFEEYFASGKSMEEVLNKIHKTRDNNPFAQIITAAFDEWDLRQIPPYESRGESIQSHGITSDISSTIERLRNSMQIAANKALDSLDSGIATLATVGSTAPFIGLFGTVWGIMSSFQSIATAQNTSLAIVAPGIAEALLATAFGLIAAIPAVVFYNTFSRNIEKFSNRVDDFQLELLTVILKEIHRWGS